MADLTVGDADAVKTLVRKFGSHYVSRVDVGDVVYQVYALNPEQYAALKAARPARLNDLKAHLAAWAVKEVGRPLAASGDRDVLSFLEEDLLDGSSPSLLRLLESPALLAELESLTDFSEAATGLSFSSLRQFVPDPVAREFYDGVVATNAALWQSNI